MKVLTIGSVIIDHIAADLPNDRDSWRVQYLDIAECLGGHPANCAIDLVRLGIPGSDIGVISCVGRDADGEFVRAELKKHGLLALLKATSTPTARNLILVPKGDDRIFFIDPGANMDLDSGFVIDQIKATRPDAISIRPGYSGIDHAAAEVLAEAKDSFVLLDIMKPYAEDWSIFLPVLEHVDAIHGTASELCTLAGNPMGYMGKPSLPKAVRMLRNAGIGLVLATDGERGASLWHKNFSVHQPAPNVEAVDPSGCGDAFCAGVIFKLLEWEKLPKPDLSLEEAESLLLFAQSCGAACISAVGTTTSVTAKKVEEILGGGKE